MNWKDLIKSRGVMGPVVTILVLILNAAFGLSIGTETQEEITALLVTIGGTVGSVVGLVGRVKAKGPIPLKKPE